MENPAVQEVKGHLQRAGIVKVAVKSPPHYMLLVLADVVPLDDEEKAIFEEEGWIYKETLDEAVHVFTGSPIKVGIPMVGLDGRTDSCVYSCTCV